MDYTLLIEKLNSLPQWSIYVIYIVLTFISLIVYFKIFFKLLKEVQSIYTLQSANDRLFMTKVVGYIFIGLFLVEFLFFATCFTLLLKKLLLLSIGLFGFFYIKSSFNLLNQLLTVKFTPHLIQSEDKEFYYLCGEINLENGIYYLDSPFLDDKIRI